MSSNLPNQQSTERRQGGNIFQSLFGWDPFRAMSRGMGMDVTSTEDGYNVEIPVPGFRPEDIEITFESNTLMVAGKSERRTFTQMLELPDEIDPQKISAHVEHGLLCLHLSRRPEARPRRIEVTAGQGEHNAEASENVRTVTEESPERQAEGAERR